MGEPVRKASQLFHTLRYLKPTQVYWRLWRKVYSPAVKPFVASSRRERQDDWIRAAVCAPSMLAKDRFRFLNEDGELISRESWNDPKKEKLWLYNLHYFDDLNADGADGRSQWHRALIARWIDENPIGVGNGWEPYCVFHRILPPIPGESCHPNR